MKENIEEVIERLEKSINDVWFSTTYSQEDEERDLRVILSDYKRVLKENEELRTELNEENKRCMMLAIEKQDYFEKYTYQLHQNDNLTREFNYVIPVQKIKDKIEELEEKRIKMEKEDIGVGFTLGEEWSDLKSKIKAYKDLLEERGE